MKKIDKRTAKKLFNAGFVVTITPRDYGPHSHASQRVRKANYKGMRITFDDIVDSIAETRKDLDYEYRLDYYISD